MQVKMISYVSDLIHHSDLQGEKAWISIIIWEQIRECNKMMMTESHKHMGMSMSPTQVHIHAFEK